MKRLLTIFLLLAAFSIAVKAQSEEEQFINDLLSQMTLEEKAGQVSQYSWYVPGYMDKIRNGEAGSVLYVFTVWDKHLWPEHEKSIIEAQRVAVEESRLGIPLLIGMDVVHGFTTTFPVPLAEAASFNPAIAEQAAAIAAWEAAQWGINWTFAPMVDISRDPRWGRVMEGAGEDSYLGAAFAKARVKGFQGDDYSAPDKLAATAKHFAAYGLSKGGREYNSVDISQRELREIYLPPFKAAVDAGVASIMSAFNDVAGIPATANSFLLRDVLREEWGFEGLVLSDWDSVGELVAHGMAKNKVEAAEIAIKAGVDLEMAGTDRVGYCYFPHLPELVESGKVEEAVLDEAVKNILRVKYRLGLFENPYVNIEWFAENHITQEERNKVALQASREAIVLLKNDDNVLPLDNEDITIALIGPHADSAASQVGNWTVMPDFEQGVTIREALVERLGDENVMYAKGCEFEGDDRSGFEAALAAADKADVIVAAMGESGDMSGEARSRTVIDIPGVQTELLEQLKATGKPVVLVLSNGRPLVLTNVLDNTDAIVESWQLGDQTGNAVADVLLGDYNPSGKLPVTFPYTLGQIPIHYDHFSTGRPFEEDNKFTTKYIDAPNEPLFPFGFGLSYTEFSYENLSVTPGSGAGHFSVSVDVTNSGEVAGEEVVQLYLQDMHASVVQPVKELKGFKKVYIEPGTTVTVTFDVTPEELSFWNADMQFVYEPGLFKVMAGGSSADVIAVEHEVE